MQQQFLTFLTTRLVPFRRYAILMLAIPLLIAAQQAPVSAQSMFSPAIRVNDEAITYFELDQRALFLTLLRIPGDPEEMAHKGLIEDRLKQQAMKEAGITIDPDSVKTGIEQLSSRTQLSPEEFIKALGEGGVSSQTVRDYVGITLAWRDLIAQKYLAQARPSEQEIDRAIGQTSNGGVQVLLSEIIMPVGPDNFDQVEAAAVQISNLSSYDEFSQAAAQYSASDTRTNGGKLDWLSINKLPPALQPVVLGLKAGEITTPIALPNAVALFQMRGVRETSAGTPRYSAIDYATYFIPGGRSAEALATAKSITDRIDICEDLYGIAKDQPPSVLERQSVPPKDIPRDIALELATMDPGEVSTAITRSNGQTLVLLMMCGRTTQQGQQASREEIANALTERRLGAFSESYLQQLKAEARIVEK